MDISFDASKIYYCLILDKKNEKDVTPFQFFSRSWENLHWALHQLALMPADIFEPKDEIEELIIQRMGGARRLCWAPLDISSLEQAEVSELGVFFVCFSGEREIAERVARWCSKQSYPVFHISNQEVPGACYIGKYNDDALREHCLKVLHAYQAKIPNGEFDAAKNALTDWEKKSLLRAIFPERVTM